MLCSHEDLASDFQHRYEKLGVANSAYKHSAEEVRGRDKKIARDFWLIAWLLFSAITCLNGTGKRVITWTPDVLCMHACVHTCTYTTHTYTVHTHAPKKKQPKCYVA